MELQEFSEHFESFVTYAEEAWNQKDLEMLNAMISDLENFVHAYAHQFKCYSMNSKDWKELYRKNREKRREIADGICEWCNSRQGRHCHHLIKRGRLSIYNDVRLLRVLCPECHSLFHL